jgi:hypothetical protein
MASYTITATADGDYRVAPVRNMRGDTCHITMYAQGTWGGGTLTWKISFDGGTTLIPMLDMTSVAVTLTSDGSFDRTLGNGNRGGVDPLIYASISGSTTPSLTIGVLDNN